jgi:hypothetical protein
LSFCVICFTDSAKILAAVEGVHPAANPTTNHWLSFGSAKLESVTTATKNSGVNLGARQITLRRTSQTIFKENCLNAINAAVPMRPNTYAVSRRNRIGPATNQQSLARFLVYRFAVCFVFRFFLSARSTSFISDSNSRCRSDNTFLIALFWESVNVSRSICFRISLIPIAPSWTTYCLTSDQLADWRLGVRGRFG